jgi:hypothetical protein
MQGFRLIFYKTILAFWESKKHIYACNGLIIIRLSIFKKMSKGPTILLGPALAKVR